MGHIFGDSDDITFGASFSDARNTQSSDIPSARPVSPQRQSQKREPQKTQYSVPKTLDGGLVRLIESMKSSFLPAQTDASLKFVLLSEEKNDPMFLIRYSESTFLVGTGFSVQETMGQKYQTFPDMRLPYSEKDRITGWILPNMGFSIQTFSIVFEAFGFPHIYAPRDVIAYIRAAYVSRPDLLEKCRFFEILTPDSTPRTVGDLSLSDSSNAIHFQGGTTHFVYVLGDIGTEKHTGSISFSAKTFELSGVSGDISPVQTGEVYLLQGEGFSKHTLRFTFDTFYLDKNSVGVVAGYTLKDRAQLAENGVLTFVLEEDIRSRAIVGHIFIDSRGFVHSQEMMLVHKEILKGIRHTYEEAILAKTTIERAELVQILRREITKYCYLLTGRTPVVMPIIIER